MTYGKMFEIYLVLAQKQAGIQASIGLINCRTNLGTDACTVL